MDINQLARTVQQYLFVFSLLNQGTKKTIFSFSCLDLIFFEKFYKLLLTLFIGIGSRHDELSGGIS
jgi:hypothetical protein